MQRTWALVLGAAAAALLAPAALGVHSAAAGPTQCAFSTSDPAKYGAQGTATDLVNHGSVAVKSRGVYYTEYTVDVGVWVDDSFAQLAADAPALALSYFEHANCILALGQNQNTGGGDHHVSLRIAGDVIRYYPITTPPVSGASPWIQQVHWDFRQGATGRRGAPKVNVLISARSMVDLKADGTWGGVGGASNGVGQGQAIVLINPAVFRNGMVSQGTARPLIEDWWGDIIAHEVGHALGRDGHTTTKFDTMCCAAPTAYTQSEIGFTPSKNFSMSAGTWQAILNKNNTFGDQYVDPYATTPNPVTNVTWSYAQINHFLKPYTSAQAVKWVDENEPVNCRNAPDDASKIQCRTLPAYQTCLGSFPYSPVCNNDGQVYTEPCCFLYGGW
jgi:hypothetical protein